MSKRIAVKRTGRTWSIYVEGALVEGGFFSRDAAVLASKQWAAPHDQPKMTAPYDEAS